MIYDNRTRIEKFLPWLIIAIGIILRLRQYTSDRSLWIDEAYLALNIINRSFAGLFQPLGYDQNAPIGFLLLSKLAAVIGGHTSLALRFFPFIFGIIALFLFYRVARHFLRTPGTLVALTVFSFATSMVAFSAEYKPYMGDVLCTLILWYFFIVARPKNKRWLALIGVIVLWFSYPSFFILAALSIADMTLWTYAVPFWLAGFGLDYFLIFRNIIVPVNISAWHGHFLLFFWQDPGGIRIFLQTILRMFGYFIDVSSPWIQLPVLLSGYVAVAGKNAKHIIVMGLPIVFVFIASGFQKYPFVPRLLLFLAPSLYIAIGAGVDLLIARIGRKVILILLPVLLWGIIPSAASALVSPLKVEETKQVFAYLHDHYKPGDVIYIYYGAEAAFKFYAKQYGLNVENVIIGVSSRENLGGYQKDLQKLKGRGRVWLVFSHILRRPLFNEDQFMVAYVDGMGRLLDYYPQVGASVYLYDLR